MMLDMAIRYDVWFIVTWTHFAAKVNRFAERNRMLLAFLIVALSIADLVLTQNILTMVSEKTYVEREEKNSFMLHIVMSWWAWPVRIGIPLLIAVRDLRRRNYQLMLAGVVLYGAVVLWNLRMLYLVVTA